MRNFGFELEIKQAIRRESDMLAVCVEAMKKAGYEQDAEMFTTYGEYEEWVLKTDHCGWEITSPILRSSKANLEKVGKWIDELRKLMLKRGHTQRQLFHHCTGLHVHVDAMDMRDKDTADAVRAAVKFEPTLARLNDKIRMTNHGYSIPLREEFGRYNGESSSHTVDPWDVRDVMENFDVFLSLQREGDMKAIKKIQKVIQEVINDKAKCFFGDMSHRELLNHDIIEMHEAACNYSEHDTLEFRHGLGSLNGEQIKNWIATLIFLVDAGAKNPVNLTLKDLKPTKDMTPKEIQANTNKFITWLRQTEYSQPWMQRYQRTLVGWLNHKMKGQWRRTARRS